MLLARDLRGFLRVPRAKFIGCDGSLFPELHAVERQLAQTALEEIAIQECEQVAGFWPGGLVEDHAVERLECERLLDGRETRDLEDFRLERIVFPRRVRQRVCERV